MRAPRTIRTLLGVVGPAVLFPLLLLVGLEHGREAAGAAPAGAPDARTVYLRDCAVCHGPDGRGTASGPTLAGWGRAGVDYVLTTGRMPLPDPGAKPERRAPKYDGPTITALEDYIDTLGLGGPGIPDVEPGAGNLAAGGEIFRAQCAACHEWAGDGGALLNREAPPLGSATATQVGEAARIGPGAMPRFGQSALSDADLNGVARYVQYIDHPDDRGGQPLWHLGPVAEGAAGLAALAVLVIVIRLIGSRP